jgi:signal transduction histidine kinase
MIEELGLLSVLRVYIESFSVRTGMHVEFEVLDSYTRVPSELEITLFRVACESLNSALQHLNSSWARVRLTAHATEARISLEYDIDPSLRTVIGHSEEMGSRIRHIKERVQQLGGQITFQSADHRSVLEAVLPLSRSASATGV